MDVKLEYTHYLYLKLYDIGEPIDGNKLKYLRDIVYTGQYRSFTIDKWDNLTKKYFTKDGYHVDDITTYMRNKKINQLFL